MKGDERNYDVRKWQMVIFVHCWAGVSADSERTCRNGTIGPISFRASLRPGVNVLSWAGQRFEHFENNRSK